jgi:hydroxymethylpyrimidine/phosphomethylpyrimidine kinase
MREPISTRPYVISIAGFDPSAGAGILADIKTFEANKVYGLGVCSAITFQNEDIFTGLKWIPAEDILRQLDLLLNKHKPTIVKIGLIENLDTLERICKHLHAFSSDLQIIWDPILKASAGFDFHSKLNMEHVYRISSSLSLITPNIPEALELGETDAAELNMQALSKYCAVFLKGGHSPNRVGEDFLFLKNGKRVSFGGRVFAVSPKHGSGCVLSSAIAARMAKGADLEKACLLAKEYTLTVLESNETLLGYHVMAEN